MTSRGTKPSPKRWWALYGWGLAACFVALYGSFSGDQILAVRETLEMQTNSYDPANGRKIVKRASKYLGVGYVWGGTTASGFDCSGFTRYIYKSVGYRIPRNARGQFKHMHPIKEPGVGDLVFFRTRPGPAISHVGIYVGKRKFIHSPRPGHSIRYDSMDSKYWKTRYMGARTIR